IVYVNLPELDSKVECGKSFTDVESVKAVSEVLSPCCGTIVNVNDDLENEPEKINNDPYGSWIIEVEVSGYEEGLMTEEEYKEFIKK
ncbi:MAG: glycine cleavage system protein H, partial [Clostridia bacterium]